MFNYLWIYSLDQVTVGVGLPVTEQANVILLPSFTIIPEISGLNW